MPRKTTTAPRPAKAKPAAKPAPNALKLREDWLTRLGAAMAPAIAERAGLTLPPWRATCGFPSRGGEIRANQKRIVLGQCWSAEASADKHAEVFVSPIVDDPRQVAVILAHELIHAALPGHGHDRAFQRAAAALGYAKPFTEGNPTDAFWQWIEPLLGKLPAYPHAQLAAVRPEGAKKKQGTRMIKCECDACGYVVRTTRKWIEQAGAPICPVRGHGQMTAELPDDDAGDDGEA